MPFEEVAPLPGWTTQPLVDIIIVSNPLDILKPSTASWTWLCDSGHLVTSTSQEAAASLSQPKVSCCRLLLDNQSLGNFRAEELCTEQGLQAAAHNLLDDLFKQRQTDEERRRSLIFIGHGIGGLIVKYALIIVIESRTSNPWLHSLYLSTCSVMFAATPHYGVSDAALQMVSLSAPFLRCPKGGLPQISDGNTDALQLLHRRFRPLTDSAEVYHLWELQPTNIDGLTAFFVEKSSAVPHHDRHHAEAIAVEASHRDILALKPQELQGFSIVANALKSCFRHAVTRTKLRSEALADNNDDQPSRLNEGHKFQNNTISGGRAHFGDSITNIYVAHGDNLSEVLDAEARYLPARTSRNYRKASNLTRTCSVHFTGREKQLKELNGHFGIPVGNPAGANSQDDSRVVIVHGLGGAGKTELCLKFADQARHKLFWGIFWIDASSRETAEHGYCALGQMQGIGASFEASKFWLDSYPHPWLLILDNADDPTTKVAELVPRSTYGHIIITTRNRSLGAEFPNSCEIELGVMIPNDAVAFLLAIAGRKNSKQEINDAEKVAETLGYLALALKLAGAAIRKAFKDIGEFLKAYTKLRPDEIESRREYQEESTAIRSWRLSLQKMGQNSGGVLEDAMSLLSVVANLHFQSISWRIFEMAWLSRERNNSAPMTLDPLGLETGEWDTWRSRMRRAMNALHDYSILDYDSENGVCAMHPVIHRWTRLEQREREGWKHWQSYTMDLLARCISPHLEPSTRAFRRSLLPHIESCCGELRTLDLGSTQAARDATIGRLERFALVYAEAGQWKKAVALQQYVVAHREVILGVSHHQTLAAKRTISQMHWDSFAIADAITTRAEILVTRTFSRPRWSDWRPIWPPRYFEYCIALDDLTQGLWLAGELGLSQHTGQIARGWLLDALGATDPLTLTATLNLARTYSHLGKLEDARNLLEENVNSRLRLFGKNHPDTLMAQNELGMVYLACKRYDEAEVILIEVYQRRQDVLGEEHAYTLWSANDLAKVYFSRETDHEVYPRAADAVTLLKSIIPVVERTLGKSHGGMVMTKGNLARALVRAGELTEAKSFLEDIFNTVNATHPSWAEVMAGMAEVQMRRSETLTDPADVHLRHERLKEARSSCEQVLRKLQSTPTPQLSWAFRFTGPKNPIRSSDLQRNKILKLKTRIETLQDSAAQESPNSFKSAFSDHEHDST